MEEEKLNKRDIFKYGYYDDSGKYIIVLNEEYLKKYFEADIITLKDSDYK